MPYKTFKVQGGFKNWKVDEQGKKIGDPLSDKPMSQEAADAQRKALYASENKKEATVNLTVTDSEGNSVLVQKPFEAEPEPDTEAKEATAEKCDDMAYMAAPMPMMPNGAMSLKDLLAAEAAHEAAEEVRELTGMFHQVVDNIMASDSQEKDALLINVAGEFAEMARQAAQKTKPGNPMAVEAKEGWKPEQMAADPGEKEDKAKWTVAYKNNLPDSAFLFVESGGEKDDQGKTVPRSLRHLPYKDAEGNVALPQLRNAISRLGQSNTGTTGGDKWLTEAVRKRLMVKAQGILEAQSKKELFIWKEGGVYHWIAAYSNNRRDNDNPPEIIASKSHKAFDDALGRREFPMPELWLWHIPYKVGTTLWHAYDETKGFPLAAGVFDKGQEWAAEALLENKDWSGVSHGMPVKYIQRDPKDPTIIVRHVTKEISILPAWAAANKLSFHLITKEAHEMQDEKGLPAHKLQGLIDLAGEERAQQVEAALTNKAKEADEQEIEKKEETPAAAEVATDVSRDELKAALGLLTDTLKELDDRLKALEEKPQAAEETADKEFDLVAFLKEKSIIGKEEAKVDGRTQLAKDGPEETPAGTPTANQVGLPIGLVDRLFQSNQAYYNGGK